MAIGDEHVQVSRCGDLFVELTWAERVDYATGPRATKVQKRAKTLVGLRTRGIGAFTLTGHSGRHVVWSMEFTAKSTRWVRHRLGSTDGTSLDKVGRWAGTYSSGTLEWRRDEPLTDNTDRDVVVKTRG